ncbi:MAG: winged helix-turn-helix domain-containing protein [Pyrinomonadaceae bacterium]|nr:winged helix-turn-helix domain-containing protein [Pyrinomonadaceae bacterium]
MLVQTEKIILLMRRLRFWNCKTSSKAKFIGRGNFESGVDKQAINLYQFEDFSLNVPQKCLWRGSMLVSLTPKAFDTLLVLVKNRGAVVEKNTLLNEVWTDTFVEEATLAQNISTLRKILGASTEKPFIETIPRRGYRFVAEVREIVDAEQVFIERNGRAVLTAVPQMNGADNLQIPSNGKNDSVGKSATNSIIPGFSKPNPLFNEKNKLTALILLTFTALGVLTILYLRLNPRFADSKFRETRFTKLTSGEIIFRGAISPDGKYLASVNRRNGGDWSLQVRQISNETAVEVIPPTSMEFIGLTFSPDSQSIYYTIYPKERRPDGTWMGTLYKIPLFGGVPEQLLNDIDSPITISPDNREFAFLRNNPEKNESAIIIAGFDGRPERKLAIRSMKKGFSVSGPAWSPDGKTLSCGANSGGGYGSQMELLTIDTENGETKSLVSENLQWIGKTAWFNDGSGIIYPAFFSNSQNLTDQIWIASFPDGKTRLVTNGIEGLRGMSLTSDSNSFITIRAARSTSYWIHNLKSADDTPQRIKQNFSEISLVPQNIALMPDKKILFDSTKNGNSDIWVMNQDGSGARPLTGDPQADYSPEVSPDGKLIIFLSNRSGATNLWRMNADGTDVRKLTESASNIFPGVATDGKFAYYSQRIGDNAAPTLWKVSLEGGESVQLNGKAALNPGISPDGKLIACFYADAESDFGMKLTVISIENGAPVKQFNVRALGITSKIFWSRDGQSIFFLKNQDGISTVYRQPLASDSAVKVIESKTDTIFRFGLTAAEDFIVYESGSLIQEVILVENRG